jgi:hypothetical protein
VPQEKRDRRRGRLRSTTKFLDTRLEAGFFHFGAVTLCRCSQHWVDFHPTTRTARVSGTPVEGVVTRRE